MVRRVVVIVALAAMLATGLAFATPASAQGGGCKAFGKNIAGLAQDLGPLFGQAAASSAPLNDTVETEQQKFC